MVAITGSPFYTHSFQAEFRFSFGTVRLSVAFFNEWAYIVLPDNKETLWKIVKEESELFDYLKTLRKDTEKFQFIIRFGDSADCGDGHTIIRPDLATHERVIVDGPVTESPTPYSLPFGAR